MMTGLPALRQIGDAIRAARRRNGLTQTQLAELVGLSDRTIREIEKGSGGVSAASTIQVAEADGVRVGVTS